MTCHFGYPYLQFMATAKQKKAIQKIVENHGNVSKAMREAGYADASAKNPKNLTESKGFKELCEDCGLTDDLIIKSLVEDIKMKPQNRKPELELGAKIKGLITDKIDHTTKGEPIKQINYITPNGGDNNTPNG